MSFQQQIDDIKHTSIGISSNNVFLTQKVYSDLVLAKKWNTVDYKPVKELDSCILLAYEPENMADQLIIIPILQDKQELSINHITEIFKLLDNSNTTNSPIERITFAIYSSDSTILYYHITRGLNHVERK